MGVWIRHRVTGDGDDRYLVEYRLGGRETRVRHGGSFATKARATIRAEAIRDELAGLRAPHLTTTPKGEPMPGKPRANRQIELEITEADRATAIASNSGGCLIADALKRQGFTAVSVDMATIRVSDKDAGLRFVFLTPPAAQHLLLSFDQGWPNPTERVILKRPVRVLPIKSNGTTGTSAYRATRVAELEANVAAGTATKADRGALTILQKHPDRPATGGPAELTRAGVVVGGRAPVRTPDHPNLLRGRNRIFGAKLADPGVAFREAVDAAVRERSEAES